MRTLESKIRTEAKIYYDYEGDKIYITGNEEIGFWYCAKGTSIVNYTLKISESDNINEWKDLDCFTWNEKIMNLETFIEACE